MSTSKKQLAKEGELRFAAEFIKRGWNIFLPYGEDSPVDLLIEREGKFQRVQIKSTHSDGKIVMGRLKSSNNWQVKKYSGKDIDLFGVYDSKTNKGYLIPLSEVSGMIQISLRLEETKNNQQKGIRLANKYEYF